MILMYFLPNILVSHFEGVFEHISHQETATDKGVLANCHPQLYFCQFHSISYHFKKLE
jgi:hypothetical protein